jgi:hypothetical protein
LNNPSVRLPASDRLTVMLQLEDNKKAQVELIETDGGIVVVVGGVFVSLVAWECVGSCLR